MSTWKTRGLRGSTLEEMINRTNDQYREQALALVQKIPTPITPIKMDKTSRHITLAYFEQKSTVDYLGVVQGVPVCFDAKECKSQTFALANVHEHQLRYMQDFERQKGISFLLIYYSSLDKIYYMRLAELQSFVLRAQEGGLKRVKFEELNPDFFLPQKKGVLVPYLEGLQRDLLIRG